MMPYAHHHPATHTGWPICCHSVWIMGGYLLILPMIFLPFFLPLLQRKIKKERNWKQRPPLKKKKRKKDKSRGGFNYKSFSVIKNQVHRRSTLKVPCVTISLFPNPSVNRQPEEGCTHFHFSALAELLRKKHTHKMISAAAELLFPLRIVSTFHTRQPNKNIFVQYGVNRRNWPQLFPRPASGIVH